MNKVLLMLFLVFVFVVPSYAQVPVIGFPMHLDLGIGGGVSWPNETLLKHTEPSGWNAGIKARIHGILPVSFIGSVVYNRIRNKIYDSDIPFGVPFEPGEADVTWMIGGGLEYSLPIPLVTPYLGVEGLLNLMSNSKEGASSVTRGGVGLGGGVQFSIPAFGSVDASLKYQIFNLIGKENAEDEMSQVAASIAIMFSVL